MRRSTLEIIPVVALLFAGVGAATAPSVSDRPAGPPVVLAPSDVKLPVDTPALERQYRALSAMPSVKVTYSPQGLVSVVEGHTGVVLSPAARTPSVGDSGQEVLNLFRDVLLVSGEETLKVGYTTQGLGRTRMIRMEQFIDGIPVVSGLVMVKIEEATGIVRSFGARFLPDRQLPRDPKITASAASTAIIQYLEARGIAERGSVETSAPTLAYHGLGEDVDRGRLVWEVIPSYVSKEVNTREDATYWIDASDGAIVGSGPFTTASLNRTVYTANGNSPSSSGFPTGLTHLFNEGGSSADPLAVNAYNNAGRADAVYSSVFSFAASPLMVTVNYGSTPGAFHTALNGKAWLSFNNGNATYGPFGNALDAVAHEYGHHVVFKQTNGLPQGGLNGSDPQGAALDEAFGDITAMNVDIYDRPGIVPASWLIAEVFINNPTQGIRSAENPKSATTDARDWFPARSTDKASNSRHRNATILTHAFKLMATGGQHVRSTQPIGDGVAGNVPSLFVTAIGHNKAAQVMHQAMIEPSFVLDPTFGKLKLAADQAASLYGPLEQDGVDRAFRAVGVGVGCTAPPPPPTLNVFDMCPTWRLNWTPVPGATKYHGQRNPAAWGWTDPATWMDQDAQECLIQVTVQTKARLRACNGCGCSAWSNTVDMWKWPQCP